MTDGVDAPRQRRPPREPVALLLAGLLEPAEAATDLFGVPHPVAAPAAPHPAPVELRAEVAAQHPAASASAAVVAAAPSASHLDALDQALEAVLVAADRPLDLATLAGAVDRPIAVVRQAVLRIRDDWDGAGGRRRGFELREVATGWRLYARPAHDEVVRALVEIETAGRLTQAALETLAVVAYRQPVSRGQVAAVRAVSVDSVLKTLVARGLVEEVGRTEAGAVLYGTTDALLVALGIRSLDELPPLAPLLEGAEAASDAR